MRISALILFSFTALIGSFCLNFEGSLSDAYAQSAPSKLTLVDASGEIVAALKRKENKYKLILRKGSQERQFSGKVKSSEKLKIKEGENLVAKIKYKDYGFKVYWLFSS